MKKILKRSFAIIGILVALIAIIGIAFLNISPQFGGSVSSEQQKQYSETGHYENGIFTNAEEIKMEMDCHSITAMLKETMNPNPNVAPSKNIEVEKINPESLSTLPDTTTRITWLGHSSFLIETGGKKILIDPVFGMYAAPHSLLGRARFNKEMPIALSDFEQVDAIIISHDHYDHLDYPTIKELKSKTNKFFVPLGVGNHLRRWEIAEEKIVELDWWTESEYENLTIILTPSRHMSGRGLTDQSATLWGAWIIQSPESNIFYSGDGGYGKHFKQIGDKYGPFDVGLMECGQYNELWKDVHMMPEQTAMAAADVKAQFIVPVHWGSFALATHSWTDPAERITKAAKKQNIPLATPKIGESITLPNNKSSYSAWWVNFLP